MAYELLLLEREPPLATITLNRPDKRNALSHALRLELAAAIGELDTDDELEAAAIEWGERLAAGPTRALGLAKRLLNRSLESDLATSLAEEALTQELINQTDDIKEGMIAFGERRDPNFSGT